MTHPHAYILQAIIDGKEVQFSANGQYWDKITHNPDAEHDLILGSTDSFTFRIKPTTVTINGVELEDDRITEVPLLDEQYFVEEATNELYFHIYNWRANECGKRILSRGIAHHTKEGAIAFCKTRLGIKD